MYFRPATAADVIELTRIEHAQPASAQWGEAGFLAELHQPAACVWCAQVNKQVVGFICARTAAGMAEILNFAVSPAYTHQGIGRALLRTVMEQLKARGTTEITLEVNEHNSPALSLYRAEGFCEVGRRKKFYQNREDALLLQKIV